MSAPPDAASTALPSPQAGLTLRTAVKPALALAGAAGAATLLIGRLPLGAPRAVILVGIIIGSLNGLLAIGIVLVYRANRVINFAQGELGAFAAVLAFELISAAGWNYLLSVGIALVAAVGMSILMEVAVMRRFSKAPRLIVTVVTIGLTQIFAFLELGLPAVFERYGSHGAGAVGTHFPTPFGRRAFSIFPIQFSYDHVIIIIAVPLVLAALVGFFRRSWTGIGIRGAAENAERAAFLGIPTPRLSTLAWAIAGGLSAVGAILKAPVAGFATGALAGPGLLLRAIVAATIARFESFPIAFAASLALGVMEQLVFYNYARAAPIDGLLLGIIIVALLARRRSLARAEWREASAWTVVQEVRPIPEEMANLVEVRRGRYIGMAVLAAALLAAPLLVGVRELRLLSVIWIYGIVAVSLVILVGWAGQVSLGQWALVGVGAFTAAKLATLPDPPGFFVSLLAAGLAGAAVALVIGLPALRIRGFFLGGTTLALAVAAGGWFFTFELLQPASRIPRPVLFGLLPLAGEARYYYVALAFLAIAMLAARNIRRSRIGRLFVASRDNEQAARSYGVDIVRAKLTAFAVSGFIAAFAGGLYAFLTQTISYRDFPSELSLFVFAMAVIGGLGSIAGGVLGAVYVQGAQFFLPEWGGFLATGLGMLILLMVLPGGLGQLLYQYRDRFLRRSAARRGLVVPSLVADRREEASPLPITSPSGLRGAGGDRSVSPTARPKTEARPR